MSGVSGPGLPRILGGISRDVSGRRDEPLKFNLTIDRRLRSNKLDTVQLTEAEIIKLVESGASALALIHAERTR